MAVRDAIEKRKPIVAVAAVVVTLGAIVFAVYQMMPERQSTSEWYTADDGQTWFKDTNKRVSPFDYNGKQAVLAHVRECDGKQFVAYMQRYNERGRKVWEQFRADEAAGKEGLDEAVTMGTESTVEYKKPGDKEWVQAGDGQKILAMLYAKCPDGVTDPLVVMP